MFEDEDGREYRAVRNDDGRYSIWPAGHALPTGWYEAESAGPKAACLAYVARVWTDLGTDLGTAVAPGPDGR
jgi:MbtH protein